jgi:hypothetical protein
MARLIWIQDALPRSHCDSEKMFANVAQSKDYRATRRVNRLVWPRMQIRFPQPDGVNQLIPFILSSGREAAPRLSPGELHQRAT